MNLTYTSQESILTAHHRTMLESPRPASLLFPNGGTNSRHTQEMPVAVLDAGAGKASRPKALPFLSLEITRKQHSITPSWTVDLDKAEHFFPTTGRATPAFSWRHEISCLAAWFLTVFMKSNPPSCCAEEDGICEGFEDPGQVIPEVILKAKQSDSLLPDPFF